VIDAVYTPASNHIIRVYVNQSNESYSEIHTSDGVRENNGQYDPYEMTVHDMSLTHVEFEKVHRQLDIGRFIDTDLYTIPIADCAPANMIVGSSGGAAAGTWLGQVASRGTGVLSVDGTYYIFTGSVSTSSAMAVASVGSVAITAVTPTVQSPVLDAADVTVTGYSNKYSIKTGCVVDGEIFLSGFTLTPMPAIYRFRPADGSTSTSYPGGSVEMLRAKADGTLYCVRMASGVYALGTVDKATLAWTIVIMTQGSVTYPSTPHTSGFIQGDNFFFTTATGLYKFDTGSLLLTQFGSEGVSTGTLTTAGAVSSSTVRYAIPLANGDIAVYCASAVGTASKHLIVLDPLTGAMVGSLFTLPETLHISARMMQISPNVLVFISQGGTVGTYSVAVLNMTTGVTAAFNTSTSLAASYASYPFLAIDGRCYLLADVGGSKPLHVQGCIGHIHLDSAAQARLQSHELNYF
jgi:hypothetical protein